MAAATYTVWVGQDGKKQVPSFEGVLVLFNVSEANRKSIPPAFLAKLSEEVNQARAAGWMVLYLCDTAMGTEPPPEEFDRDEEGDFVRLLKQVAGMDEMTLDILPDARTKQVASLMESMRKQGSWSISGKRTRVAGLYKINGVNACLEPMEA